MPYWRFWHKHIYCTRLPSKGADARSELKVVILLAQM